MFKVAVTEKLVKFVDVEANNVNEAEDIVRGMYERREITLDSDDYLETDVSALQDKKRSSFLHAQLNVLKNDAEAESISYSVMFSDGIEAVVSITKKGDFYEKNITLFNGGCKIASESFSEPALSTFREIPYFSDIYCLSVMAC